MDSRYTKLAESIGLGHSERIARLFKMIADSDEADLLLALPADAPGLSKRFGKSVEETQKMIDLMFYKGLIFPSHKTDPPTWRRGRDMIQFHDATLLWPDAPKEFIDRWQEWTETEWPEMAKAIEKLSAKPGMRIIPVGVALKAEGQVLAFEDVEALVNNSKVLAVTNCTCRLAAHKCKKTLQACVQVNNAATYAIARGTGRELTKQEALDLMRAAEEEGLIHTTFNSRSVDHVICNCCGCCCQFLPELIQRGTQVVDSSRFRAEVNSEACTACETCVDRCYFGAITMEGDVAVINSGKCLGCGVCAVSCPTGAMAIIEVRSPDHVPESLKMPH